MATPIPTIEIVCVAYKRYGPLKLFVQSILNQTAKNWKLTVYHDGPDEQFDALMNSFAHEAPEKIAYRSSEIRHNDWGHSLREEGIRHVTSEYLLITNDDNYYVPLFVQLVTDVIVHETSADVVLFDMVHSHSNPGGRALPAYSYFKTAYQRYSIDIGSAVVRSSLAKQAGFRDKTHDGDATYFEDIFRMTPNLKICKLNQVLFVHN
jgi:hypothetical protein